MAGVLVLLAGGANARATTNTVWCVPNASISPTCTSGAGKAHIQDAVSAAIAGDVVLVGPGTYHESVYIGTNNLSIFGAQAGKNARGRNGPESIVDATGQSGGLGGGAAFYVYAPYVVIDGFTIQGGTSGDFASGIFLYGYTSAYVAYDDQLVNNIIQNNAVGIDLYYYVYGTLIEYNLFKTNNLGAVDDSWSYPAYEPGYGIVGYYSPYYAATIIENTFEENLAAAIFLYGAEEAEISWNTSENDGSFVALADTYYLFVDHNRGQDFGAKGSSPWYTGVPFDGAIDLFDNNEYNQINDNDLEGGRISNYNGIAFSAVQGTPDDVCMECQVSNNTVKRFAGNGIVAEEGYTLSYSQISGNDVEDNGQDGILIGAYSKNYANTLFDNKAERNHANDCEDDTAGTGSWTAETLNTWFNNIGPTSSPEGLCAPAPPRWHW
jgi:hypothetical protein